MRPVRIYQTYTSSEYAWERGGGGGGEEGIDITMNIDESGEMFALCCMFSCALMLSFPTQMMLSFIVLL